MLLNTLRCIRQPPNKDQLIQTSVVLRLRNPELKWARWEWGPVGAARVHGQGRQGPKDPTVGRTALCSEPGALSTGPAWLPASHRLPDAVGRGPTYKGDQGGQQQDAHQKVLELLQHQLPQGFPWEQEHGVRPGPLTSWPAPIQSWDSLGDCLAYPPPTIPTPTTQRETPRPGEAQVGDARGLSRASLCPRGEDTA